ncbi:MAG TPA: response regulator [Thermomicrobiales bacterium]|nr:response regulator [Thermomicrobiales bacterium]
MVDAPILIVEDDPVIRELLLELLDIEGYPAIAVADGASALRQLKIRRPSLILLDLNLPAMDGEGFLREMRRSGRSAPVVLLTADPRGRRLRHARGIVGFLAKPFDVDELLRLIEKVWPSHRRPEHS